LSATSASLSFEESKRSVNQSDTLPLSSPDESEDNANAIVAPSAAPANTPTIIFVSFVIIFDLLINKHYLANAVLLFLSYKNQTIMKSIFFIDLDNTIYFTKPNEEQLMAGLYNLLDQQDLGISQVQYEMAKAEMLRTPFQKVAEKYGFKDEAINNVIDFLKNREVTKPLKPSEDYHYIKSLKGRKFIATAGFVKQQTSKVRMLGIADDFEEVAVIDVSISNKKEAFKELIKKHNLNLDEIMVIGDDAESEIKFGLELGLSTFLLDPENLHPGAETTFRGKDLSQLHLAAGQ
jgi:putative hydrolase of the HAD superfamily